MMRGHVSDPQVAYLKPSQADRGPGIGLAKAAPMDASLRRKEAF
jgi:hypothetical protein